MSEKKHIDRIFQERLKGFEAIPDDAVWENIKSELEKEKDDDKLIPIWWRYAGVAALLLLFLSIGGLMFNNDANSEPEIKVVDSENTTSSGNSTLQNLSDDEKNSVDLNLDSNQNESLASEDKISPQSKQESNIDNTNKNLNNSAISVDIPNDVINNETNIATTTSSNKDLNNEGLTNDNGVPKNIDNSIALDNKTNINQGVPSNSAAITSQKSDDNLPQDNTSAEDLQKIKSNKSLVDDSPIIVAQNDITEEEDELVNIASVDSLSIEEEIAKIEDLKNIIEEEKNLNRWSISPNVAPVYFNSLGNGSSIDEQFNQNSKTGEINMSYGVTGSYAINDKLVVRAGINKVNLGYNTNDILVFETTGKGPNSALLSNVSENKNDTHLSIVNARSVVLDQNSNIVNTSNVGSINQALGFVEIPIELQYNILNTKLGVNIIGGFSSFFLSENELRSEINGNSTLIGEANNVNDISYSANLGLGLNYSFSKSFNFNLEPIFKYQINTFNNVSGSFNPYFIGFYTGFSFKF
jgi:hypothetical protein